MKRIFEQITERPAEPKRKRLTEVQREANYVLARMDQGKEWDLSKFKEQRGRTRDNKRRERDAFWTLRKLDMI